MSDPSQQSGLRVLVVDDNRDVADSLAALISCWGYAVRAAYDGPSGLAAARDWRPDCLISDLSMPGMNGWDLADQSRRDGSLGRMKLVAHSAVADDRRVREFTEAGFD